GLSREGVDTGAVIVTGEAARRENARKIAELFSDETGRFVCATAGPRLETIMAAHGSGAVQRSRNEGSVLLNVDIGGGTTKVARIDRGRIEKTVALNIGARLVACDERGRLVRIEKAGRRFLEAVGAKVELGDALESDLCGKLAARMAQTLFDLLEGAEPPWPEVFVNSPVGNLSDVDGILFSGGVSEYIYGREKQAFGDLGAYLGREVESQARKRNYEILKSAEGIRATVIGASQYSVQLSGETIFVPDPASLPLHNLRVFVVRVNWEPPVAERAEQAVRETLAERDPEVCGAPHVLLFSTPPFVGYSAAQELARGIGKALAGSPAEERPSALVFEQNVGRVAGELLAKDLG
ncbi:MAG: ethanolamine ammonia-lyase reactivating factor EutA, partial [Candidatus Binatia bacterium]